MNESVMRGEIGVETLNALNLASSGLVHTLRTVLWAVLTGVVIVIAPLPLNLLVFAAWVWWLVRAARRRRGKETAKGSWTAGDELDSSPPPARPRFSSPRAVAAIHLVIVYPMILVADWLPCKHLTRYLDREVILPKTTMTLAEFAELGRGSDRAFALHLYPESEDEQVVVRFPRNRMRLVEIIETLENQTRFRRMISKCANESTVLWGVNAFSIAMVPARPPGNHDSPPVPAPASDAARALGPALASTGKSGQNSPPDPTDPGHAEPSVEGAR